MSQEIEIEFKNLVTKTDFERLSQMFSIQPDQFAIQINHYFDTKDFKLKEFKSALRIREKNNTHTLTLKQPNEIGILETHQILSIEEATAAFKNNLLPQGAVSDQLKKTVKLDIKACNYLGSLTTHRAEIDYLGGTLVFDHSFYFNENDYEIEYEVKDEQAGKKIFENLFLTLNIPLKKTDNKIRRFFQKRKEENI